MEDFPSRDEPICQIENCNCPLKHIIQLDSQKRSSPKIGTESERPQHHQQMDNVQFPFYNHFITSSQYNQQSSTSSEFFNPKRRRVNMYNEETGQCSIGNSSTTANVPDTSANFCSGSRYDQSSNPFYRTYTQQVADCERQTNTDNSKTDYHVNKPVLDTRVPSIDCVNSGPNGAQHLDVGPYQRERSKSATLLPMLPKKRGIKRYSPDPKREQDTSSRQSYETTRKLSRQASSTMKPKTDSLLLPAARSSPSPTSTISCPPAVPAKPPKYDAKSIKADMIREIDSQKDDDEDVQTFRKKLFDSFMKTKEPIKAEDENKAPPAEEKQKEEVTHTNPMTSLDYLISKTLMESEDKPFKARNNHIHEIIRGEKRGRLCLMDLVELQVEMGLA
ncbi:uncharacterized protein LOC117332662 [Pecten maximus]|uniref:uncharacterized protein LOC117332662 n=1 Tax=Pecten maximus TaxID=6579 RepID=UPI001458AF38|nr:uncharacterized protein LOC117332662 [Pecten maximus]